MDTLHELPEAKTLTCEDLGEQMCVENPELCDNVMALLNLNAELARHGLDNTRMDYLEGEQRELIFDLMKNPYESIMTEVGILAKQYQGRMLYESPATGGRVAQFATRDMERSKVDLVFRMIDFESGNSQVKITVPTRNSSVGKPADEAFHLTLTSSGEVSITQRYWSRGQYKDLTIDPESDKGIEYMWQFFANSLLATDLNDHRTVEERQQADEQAKWLLLRQVYSEQL